MKVEVAVLGSPSLISLMVSVDAKQHRNETKRNEGKFDWDQRSLTLRPLLSLTSD